MRNHARPFLQGLDATFRAVVRSARGVPMIVGFPDSLVDIIWKQRGAAALRGVGPVQSAMSWYLQRVRELHTKPIAYPTAMWLYRNGEGDALVKMTISHTPHMRDLLRARAASDGMPQATVLRRLLRQYVEGVFPGPEDTVRTTCGVGDTDVGVKPHGTIREPF